MSILKTIWCLIWPPYREKVNRRYGWIMCMKAVGYLLLKKDADMGDVEASRIINQKMRELNW